MNILYVTNMYPSKDTPFDGVFIKEQIQYCHNNYDTTYEIFVINRSGNKYLNYFKSIFKINKIIFEGDFHLIHVHFGLAGLFLLLKVFIKPPVVVTLHGSDIISYKNKDGWMQKISKMAASKAERIIILNDKMQSLLQRHRHKLVKIPCGINTELFELERSNLKNSRFLIGFPSDKNREVKNYPLFQKIVHKLIEKGYSIETLEFTNFSRNEIAYKLSQLDCLLMTSYSEGSPQIVKEAMVCRVPIITTKVGDVEILLQGIENCYVIDSFKPTPFVEKLIEFLSLRPEERITNARERIKQLALDQASVCSNIYKVYESVLMK